ncbi:transmembrane emp24 domain-containing protein 3 isoform X1 [Felis catus]|uniref:transmembrane emp24 domain-containing protein 3 isoform X1 n=1 Tax=Felis catus TaxID=9685 RepID=UPI001D19EEF0|nr:transmembrane emp24 domain-containing protein 3 isoform X1 [Felis catus]
MGPAGARPGSPPAPPLLLLLLLLLLRAERPRGAELTFELPDSAKQCFHEDVERGAKFSLDYQVITGGHYDVDCYVEDPLGKTIYRETKKQYDSFTHRAEVKGVYQFCFSNEFSTFSHKTVYFDFQVGDEPPILPDMGNRVTALTQTLQTALWEVGRWVFPWCPALCRTFQPRSPAAGPAIFQETDSARHRNVGRPVVSPKSIPSQTHGSGGVRETFPNVSALLLRADFSSCTEAQGKKGKAMVLEETKRGKPKVIN